MNLQRENIQQVRSTNANLRESKKSPNDVDRYAGRQIRIARISLGMTQTSLANAVGITFQQIQKYELGINRITLSRLVKVARVLRTNVSFFILNDESSEVENRLPAYILSPMSVQGGLELIEIYQAIKSAKARHTLISVARALVPQSSNPS